MRISDWISDVCSSDLVPRGVRHVGAEAELLGLVPVAHAGYGRRGEVGGAGGVRERRNRAGQRGVGQQQVVARRGGEVAGALQAMADLGTVVQRELVVR